MSPDGSVKPPPEEKLLRLIRGKGPRPHPDAPEALPASVAAVAVRAGAARPGSAAWMQWAVWGLGGILAAEALMLIVSVVWPVPKPVVPPVPAPIEPVTADPSAGPIAPLA